MAWPNDSERLIANIDFDMDQRSVINCGGACGGGGNLSCTYGERESSPRYPGDLTLWRLHNGELVNILLAPLCEAPELDNVLEIHAGGYQQSSENIDTTNVIPAIYTWNEETEMIMLAEEPQITPTSDPISPIPIEQSDPVYTLHNFSTLRSAFVERDFALVVEIADEALASAIDDNQLAYAFRYYRALALEALDRPDEALAEYVAIYETAPDSAWGMLAVLHFEPVED